MEKFEGKKILMFYPYGATKHYGVSIKEELIKRGAFVIGYDERPSQNSIIKIIIRKFKKTIPSLFCTYIKLIITKHKRFDFDYILVVRGEAFTKEAIDLLRTSYTKSILILYLWDILKTTELKDVIPYFDKVLSFDPEDVSSNKGLIFRPTFFIPKYGEIIKNKKIKYNVVFIGTLHSNRYNLLNIIKNYLSINNITFFIYIYVPSLLVFIKTKIIDKIPINFQEVNFKPMSLDDTLKVIAESKCIIDLNFTGQKSLSMRAFEAMASKTKYITTNNEVTNYNFYDDRNILVIDINNLRIPIEFINSPFVEIPKNILDNYTVKQLVDDIFSLNHNTSLLNSKFLCHHGR